MAKPPGQALVLVVEPGALGDGVSERLADARLVTARWPELSSTLLARLLPDAVLVPLMGRECDAVEMAERLQGLGYRGALWVAVPPLPRPAMVLREIRAAAPQLEVALLTIGR